MIYNNFIYDLAVFMVIMAVVASLIFRLTALPLTVRCCVPFVLVVLACWTPYQIGYLLGYPVIVTEDGLPQKAELLFAVPHEQDTPKTVDLLLSENGSKPRMYETILTEGMKKLLKKAGEEQAKGTRTEVVKKKVKKKPVGYVDADGGEAPYELEDSAFSLPRKDSDQ